MSVTASRLAANRNLEELTALTHDLGSRVIRPAATKVDEQACFPVEAIDALRQHRLLGAMVPVQLGGDGLTIGEICQLCEVLGGYCASTAMIFAMHQIQVACLVNHALDSEYFKDYVRQLAQQQLLLASATTELGIGGDIRTSRCALVANDERFELSKQAPVISYGEHCDAILVTCRTGPDAAASDQVQVLVHAADCQLEPLSEWDTLGFRGTCSRGFTLTASGGVEQILPTPFSEILNLTMQPVSHLTWGALWFGLASDAVSIARQVVVKAARKAPESAQPAALKLTEAQERLETMGTILHSALSQYQDLLTAGDPQAFSAYRFVITINNVKLQLSEMLIDVVGRAMLIAGISGYRNDSSHSLTRHLRDAYGASIMVSNDRIRGHNATLQVALR